MNIVSIVKDLVFSKGTTLQIHFGFPFDGHYQFPQYTNLHIWMVWDWLDQPAGQRE